MTKIPFNHIHTVGTEIDAVTKAIGNNKLAGDGPFTKQCHEWLERTTHCHKALLTHSCTAALEMAALLLDIKPGDEVIMPSYTFVSTANAFVLRGGSPVFVDIREDTLNLNERLIETAITPRTKAIVPVHYAGVSCEMDAINAIAKKHHLKVVEDAAQGVMSSYKGRTLGAIGDLGCYSFHETKNVVSGEGGALLVNDERLVPSAEVIREKGTDRSRFLRGEVDKYTWREMGSSFLPSDLIAAFLAAQLKEAESITATRIGHWDFYHAALSDLETKGLLRRPVIPPECQHNAHMYYVLLAPHINRDHVLADMESKGVSARSHYVPLHSSPAGRRYTRVSGTMKNTDSLSAQLIRLPLWPGLSEQGLSQVVDALKVAIGCSLCQATNNRHKL